MSLKLGFSLALGMDGFSGGFGGFKPPQGRVNTPPPENVETPPKKLETPPEISLIFNIPNYSLDYFTTMKLFLQLKHSFIDTY